MGCGTSKPKTPKVILITGASSGIGKACALALLDQGHVVYGCARRVTAMSEIAEHLSGNGYALELDVTKQDHIIRAVQQIQSEQDGRLDVLINNAGIVYNGPMECVPIFEAKYMFDVNFFGLARLTQEVIPIMRTQQSGMIINMSSIGGKVFWPFNAWYVASKHALEGFSDCLRVDLAPFNIKVVIVEPGYIATEIFGVSKQFGKQHESYEELFQNVSTTLEFLGDNASPASVIGKVVMKAIHAGPHAKRRYVAGHLSHGSISFRRWLGDGATDWLCSVMQQDLSFITSRLRGTRPSPPSSSEE